MKEEVLKKIMRYEKLMSGYEVEYKITSVVEGVGMSLYLFGNKNVRSSVLVYETGEVFFIDDWQQGCIPESIEEVKDYTWVNENGHNTIMLGGFPRNL